MAAIPVGEAAFAGFDVMRRKPMAVAAWGGVFLLYFLIIAGFFVALVGAVLGLAGDGEPEIGAMVTFQLMAMGGQFLLTVVAFAMRIVLSCAIYRAVLEPDDDRYAYLRVGKTELFVGLVALCVGVIIGIMLFSGLLVGGGVVLAAMVASKALAWVLGAVMVVGFVGLFAWVGLRLSMALPMTFAERRIRVFEAWELTRGQAGNLFLMMALIIAVVVAIEIVLIVAGAIIILTGMGLSGVMELSALSTMSDDAVMARAGLWGPLVVICAVVVAFVAAAVQTIMVAPWAVAYRALTKDQPAVA